MNKVTWWDWGARGIILYIYVLEGGSFSVIRGIIEIRGFQNIERGLDLIYSSGTY